MIRRLLPLAALLLLAAPVAQAQSSAPLEVRRPDGSSTTLTAAQLAPLPRVTGTASAHGNRFSYEGVDLRAVLRLAGVATDSLRRAQLGHVVVLTGSDGYSALIALTDLDESIGARKVILVDREDGKPLPAERGPRRIIIEGDQRPTRWVRQVIRIEVRDALR